MLNRLSKQPLFTLVLRAFQDVCTTDCFYVSTYHRALKTARDFFNSLWEKYVHNNMIANSGERGALKFRA